MLGELGIQVELVGQSGTTPVRSSVIGYRGIGPGSKVIVKGKVEKQDKKVVIKATGFLAE